MYAVIFKAVVKELDDEYLAMADRMKILAMKKYGCSEFTSCSEGNKEIAISYWQSKDQIQAWKDNPEHRKAQILGHSKWYESYQIQVVEVLSDYLN